MKPPFSVTKMRVGALILHGENILLLQRGPNAYSLPGGNVEPDEDIESALWRELQEELGLTPTDFTEKPKLWGLQEQRVSRPGTTPAPRKLHVLLKLRIATQVIVSSRHPEGEIPCWREIKSVADMHFYPAIDIARTSEDYIGLLQPMTDENYLWKA